MRCLADGCVEPSVAKGLCKPHWHRMRRYGSPTGGKYREGAASEWLVAHVSHAGSECLTWPFGRNSRGYGAVGFRGRRVGAHRAMCILAHGEPPKANSHAAHSCGKGHEGCVNPRHISWKTPKENQRDRAAHGTHSRGQKNVRALVTEDDVKAIRRRVSSGEPQVALAAEFNITTHAVWAIVHRRTWAWLA